MHRAGVAAAAAGILAVVVQGEQATWARPGHAYPTPLPPKRVLVPRYSLVEWFATPKPKAGQSDVVYVRLWSGRMPLAGAHLTATIRAGRHVLGIVGGTTTNSKGEAHAKFVVPHVARGTRVEVLATVAFRGKRITGSDSLTVQ